MNYNENLYGYIYIQRSSMSGLSLLDISGLIVLHNSVLGRCMSIAFFTNYQQKLTRLTLDVSHIKRVLFLVNLHTILNTLSYKPHN